MVSLHTGEGKKVLPEIGINSVAGLFVWPTGYKMPRMSTRHLGSRTPSPPSCPDINKINDKTWGIAFPLGIIATSARDGKAEAGEFRRGDAETKGCVGAFPSRTQQILSLLKAKNERALRFIQLPLARE